MPSPNLMGSTLESPIIVVAFRLYGAKDLKVRLNRGWLTDSSGIIECVQSFWDARENSSKLFAERVKSFE